MAVIEIISGDLPKQNAGMVGKALVVQLLNKGQRSYAMQNAITKITTVSETKKKVAFDIELRDGVRFRGETTPDTFHELKKYEGAKGGDYIVSEQSPEDVAKTNKKTLLWLVGILSVCLFFTDWWMWGFVGLICIWYKASSDGKSFKVQVIYGFVALVLLVTTFITYVVSDAPTQNRTASNSIAQSPTLQPEQPKTKTHEDALAEYVGSWQTVTQKSKLDDKQNVMIVLRADEPIQTKMGGSFYPTLRIRCAENKTAMLVDFDMFINNDYVPVTYRIDKEKPHKVRWSVTSDFDSLFVPNPIPLLRQLKDEDQIYVEITPYGWHTVSANFYVHGLFNAIKPVQEACGWE